MPDLSLETARALPCVHQATIPESYRDEMGHLNVMWYVHLFDRGAWGVFALFGADLATVEARQIGVFALQEHLTYRAEVHIGDAVSVYGRIIAHSAKRIHFFLTMVNDTHETLAATAEILAICIDMTVRRSMTWPDDFAAALAEHNAAHAALGWTPPLSGAIQV
ncbi:MAG: acyl-CoA thioesterase [Anaerolineales bacterium]